MLPLHSLLYKSLVIMDVSWSWTRHCRLNSRGLQWPRMRNWVLCFSFVLLRIFFPLHVEMRVFWKKKSSHLTYCRKTESPFACKSLIHWEMLASFVPDSPRRSAGLLGQCNSNMVTKEWNVALAKQGPCLRALQTFRMVPPEGWEGKPCPAWRCGRWQARQGPGSSPCSLSPGWGLAPSTVTTPVLWFFFFHIQNNFLLASFWGRSFLK